MTTRDDAATLAQALHASTGVVCLVGAGGKKTTMYALAALHGGRVALSSTSHMYRYDSARIDHVVTVEVGAAVNDPGGRVVAYAGPTDTPERVGGLSEAQLRALWARGGFELLLIKGDGARSRWIKAPAPHEPLVPAFTHTVIPVVSARVIGRRLADGIAHRPALAAAVMGTSLEAELEPLHLGRLLSADDGALQGITGTARVVPLINMVDDAALAAVAREAAQEALARTARFDRVVLASMKSRRLVEIVRR